MKPMPASSDPTATGLVPLLRYRDVGAAVDWLCTAFGFERHDAVRSQDGAVIFAQLKHGSGMIMLVPVGRSDLDELMAQPDEIGGAETQACYVVVADTEAHYHRARGAGAEIVLEMTGDGAGRRGYTCRDFEGHIWSFGTYDPWYGSSPVQAGTKRVNRRSRQLAPPTRPTLTGIAASAFLGAVLISWGLHEQGQSAIRDVLNTASMHMPVGSSELAGGHRTASESAALASALAGLAKAESARQAAVRAADVFSSDLAREVAARNAAERSADQARRELAEERSARLAAETALNDLQVTLTRERNARDSAERKKAETQARLAQELDARETLERKIEERPTTAGETNAPTSSDESRAIAAEPAAPAAQLTETGSVEPLPDAAPGSAAVARGNEPRAKPEVRMRKLSTASKPRPSPSISQVQSKLDNRYSIPPATIDTQWPYGYW